MLSRSIKLIVSLRKRQITYDIAEKAREKYLHVLYNFADREARNVLRVTRIRVNLPTYSSNIQREISRYILFNFI